MLGRVPAGLACPSQVPPKGQMYPPRDKRECGRTRHDICKKLDKFPLTFYPLPRLKLSDGGSVWEGLE